MPCKFTWSTKLFSQSVKIKPGSKTYLGILEVRIKYKRTFGKSRTWNLSLQSVALRYTLSEQSNKNRIMISNTATSPALHGGSITLDTIRRPTDVGNRRTKIVCTLGPACWSETNLATLMDAGMNVARFNFSHGDHKGHGEVLERLRKVAAQKARNIGTLIEAAHLSVGCLRNSNSCFCHGCRDHQQFCWTRKDPKFEVVSSKKV
jgi:hypothetical protein